MSNLYEYCMGLTLYNINSVYIMSTDFELQFQCYVRAYLMSRVVEVKSYLTGPKLVPIYQTEQYLSCTYRKVH